MIISGKQIQNVLKVYGEQNSVAKNNKADKGQSIQRQDQVILSSGVQEFGHLFQSIIAMSDVRPDKVSEFSQQIDTGNYQVSSRDIADKIIGQR